VLNMLLNGLTFAEQELGEGKLMAASEVPWLGARLREERLRLGVSLRGLARDVGVSASMISQIETAKTQPSVSTLYAITSALGISIEDVFSPRDAPPPSPAMDPPNALDAIRGRRRGPVVRPDERQALTLDSGVTWEMLGELPPHPVDFLYVTYPPGSTSSSTGGLMRHSGAEFGLLLSGELVLNLGFEEIRLRPGDAISFESKTPHGYRNDGPEPAVGVWFVIEQGHR
jgi:transcriptional regulator with XRE-family HTH domain